jgi:flagella basal body P-ring formation protein FlgA
VFGVVNLTLNNEIKFLVFISIDKLTTSENEKMYYSLVISLIFILLPTSLKVLAAEQPNNLARQQLTLQAEAFVSDMLDDQTKLNTKIKTMPIDKRINIPVCPENYKFSTNTNIANQANITVKAQCESKSWYMFVMLNATQMQPVVVISNPVSPGTILTKNNLALVEMDKKQIRSTTYGNIESVVGARTKRRISAGRAVIPSNLCYVCKGDKVTISAVSSSMRVKTGGEALEDGNIGDTILIRNSRSNKRIQARVANMGEVEIKI